MKRIRQSIQVNASREKVWDTMLGDASYRDWTSAFNAGGSWFEGDWSKGSRMKFLGPSHDGTVGGMLSRIAENREHEYISVEHIGLVNDGVEDTTSEEAKKWAPAYENYAFTEKDGGTELCIEADVTEEMYDEFMEMWGKALVRLKAIAER